MSNDAIKIAGWWSILAYLDELSGSSDGKFISKNAPGGEGSKEGSRNECREHLCIVFTSSVVERVWGALENGCIGRMSGREKGER